ncbi:Rpn family recombination-promoting nuclease/putative transposase [Niabella sp.]|uniref:Rpn family recombination-promoting nuclease/putative transposase n=1 Tax=Niabella sp. TaxID=1962976 RepID=UPI002603D4FF|nr:Rpn family recombination-promoting nuclease/putative transposase [Niabella sp.]
MTTAKHRGDVAVYIDPLTDFGFKRIFGTEPNKDLLIAFLNCIFNGRKHITDLNFSKTEYTGDTTNGGGAVFDLLCTGDNGEKFIIEVQRSNQKNFKERALFYTSRLISDLAPKGKRHLWNYELPEVFLVALLEDSELEELSTGSVLHDVGLCSAGSGIRFYDKLGFIYIELHKFVKTEAALKTDLEKWLYVLKNLGQMKKMPVFLRKTIFQKLFHIAEYSNLTKEEKMLYDKSLKHKWDHASVLSYAREAGKEEGIRIGEQKGREERDFEFVMNLLTNTDFEVSKIAALAQVTVAYVKQVKERIS